jgi:hypothetical protein
MSIEGIDQAFNASIGAIRAAGTQEQVAQRLMEFGDSAGRAAEDEFSRQVSEGSVSETIDMDFGHGVIWEAERDACLHCLEFHGQRPSDGSEFGAFTESGLFAGKSLDFGAFDGHPPLHPHCRCRLVPWNGDTELLEAWQREAERSVLRGWSLPSESAASRIRAVHRLLQRGSRLPRSVQARARQDIAASLQGRPVDSRFVGRFARGRDFPGRTATGPPSRRVDLVRTRRPGPPDAPPSPPGAPTPPAAPPAPATQTLQSGIASGVRSTKQIGQSAVERVTFNNGTQAIRRTAASPNEQMAHRVADAIGAPVVRTYRAPDGRLYQEVISGETGSAYQQRLFQEALAGSDTSRLLEQMQTNMRAAVASQDGKQLGLFDYLTGQSDRHMHNWFVREGHITGIDNADAFGRVISPFAERWSTAGSFTRAEADRAVSTVNSLRQEFQSMGMEAQWREMLRRAEYLRDNGRFDESVMIRNKLTPDGVPK